MARSTKRRNSLPRTEPANTLADRFRSGANAITRMVGTPWAMLIAVLVVVAWAVTGPIFHFSDTWQLVINTGTTIVTFLMVFAIQTSQNRESTALHLKIDELIASHPNARNRLIVEELATEDEIEEDERAMLERAHRLAHGNGHARRPTKKRASSSRRSKAERHG